MNSENSEDSNEIGQTRDITILIVEDDSPLLEFFSTILRHEG